MSNSQIEIRQMTQFERVKGLKILVITTYYPPEIGGASHLVHGMVVRLKEMGHEVTVVTCYPSYNLKDIPDRYRRGFRMKEVVENITIERIRMPKFSRTSKIARGIEHFVVGLFLSWVTLFVPRYDVALVLSPPLPLPWLVGAVGKVRHIPVVVNIQDLFPREAVELGMLTNRILIRIFEGMERQIYRRAEAVTVHSPGNKEHVVSRGGVEKRVHVVYNWVDTDLIHPSPKINRFSSKQCLDDRFVVSYAGTMGWAQDMGTIIECADWLRDQTKIHFVLVGDGVEKEKSVAKSQDLGLTNILWLPMQPLTVYPEILAASDVSLINLHPALRTPVVPSKLLSIMAAGRPVVASLPAESDARRIINEANCGICVDPGDGEALAGAIQRLHDDRVLASEMGLRGRAYVEAHFSQEACVEKLESILNCVVEEGR